MVSPQPNPMQPAKYYCTSCMNFTLVALKKGNGIIEALLYLCYIVPGIFYSVWRRSTPPNVCPLCKVPSLIPAAAAPPQAVATASSSGRAMRDEVDCPFCAEPILAKAKVCKHCGKEVRL